MQGMNHPPKNLQGILWSCSVDKLDLEKDKIYIINQVLSYGDLSHVKWLLSIYSRDIVEKVFLDFPIKQYREPRFNFVANYMLNVRTRLNPNRYVINTPRNIG